MPLNYNGLMTILDNAPSVDPRLAEGYVDYTTMGPNPAVKPLGNSGNMGFLIVVGIVAAVLIFSKGK